MHQSMNNQSYYPPEKKIYISNVREISTSNVNSVTNEYFYPTNFSSSVNARGRNGTITYEIEIHNNTESYKGKKVVVKNLGFGVAQESEYKNLAEYQAQYDIEAKKIEALINEELQYLPLPEGITLEYKYVKLEEVAETLEGSAKEYIVNRYLGF